MFPWYYRLTITITMYSNTLSLSLCLSLINRLTSTTDQLQYQRQRPQRALIVRNTLEQHSKPGARATTQRTSIIVTVSRQAIFHQMNILHNGVHSHFRFLPYQNVYFSTRKWSSCMISEIQVVLWSKLHSFLCLVLRFKGTNTHTLLKLNIVAAARLLWPFYIARPVHFPTSSKPKCQLWWDNRRSVIPSPLLDISFTGLATNKTLWNSSNRSV